MGLAPRDVQISRWAGLAGQGRGAAEGALASGVVSVPMGTELAVCSYAPLDS